MPLQRGSNGPRLCENVAPRKTYRMDFHQIAIDVSKLLKGGRF